LCTLLLSFQPQLLHPQAKIHWKRCADIPVHAGMSRPQAVWVGDKVYVGGGTFENFEKYLVFKYNPSRDEWSRLPPHFLRHFAMAEFMGNLITVGGEIGLDIADNKLYRFKEESQNWEKFLSQCQLLDISCQLPPPSLPSLPVEGLLVRRVAYLYPVLQWRCITVKHLSGMLLTPYLLPATV